jgi:hypothetical protein
MFFAQGRAHRQQAAGVYGRLNRRLAPKQRSEVEGLDRETRLAAEIRGEQTCAFTAIRVIGG